MSALRLSSFSSCPIRTWSAISLPAMFHPIPGMPPSAAPSCNRIEFEPSVRGAWLAVGWLAVVCLVVLAAVALPLPARVGICIGIATPALAAIRSSLLLRGRSAAVTLQWSAHGWQAGFGRQQTETPVTIHRGSFRLGGVVMVLWLKACDGIKVICIDADRQDPGAYRALCRRLGWPPRQPPDEPGAAS